MKSDSSAHNKSVFRQVSLFVMAFMLSTSCKDEDDSCISDLSNIDLTRLCEGRITLTLLEKKAPYQFILDGKTLKNVSSWVPGDGAKYFSFFDSLLLSNNTKNHELQIIDNSGCPARYNVSHREDIKLEINIISESECNKQSGEFEVTGTGFTGSRSLLFPFNAGTPAQGIVMEKIRVKDLLPGKYFVIGRDELGCNRIDFEIKNIRPEIFLEITNVIPAVVTNSCNSNGVLTFNIYGGKPPYALMSTREGELQCIPSFDPTQNWPCPFPFSYTVFSRNDWISVAPGTKTFRVIDFNGCYSDTFTFTVPQIAAPLLEVVSVSADSQCPGGNGEVILKASNVSGTPVFEHLNFGLQPSDKFVGLRSGVNEFRVISGVFGNNNSGCPSEILGVEVPSISSGVSYNSDIKPMLTRNCNSVGCHDGTLGVTQDYRTYLIVKSALQKIELRVRLKDMPPPTYPFSIPLTTEEHNKILCWIEEGGINN